MKEEKQTKNFWTKKKKLIALCIAIILVIAGITTYFVLNNKKDTDFTVGETINVEESLNYLVKGDNNEYYLTKANSDIKFQVSTEDEELKYNIIDEDENKVETVATKYENYYEVANTDNYQAGKTYTLTLENAKFTDERLKDVTKLNFTIVRPNANTQVLNKEVKKVNKKIITDIEENEDNFTLTSTKEYQKDDIIYYKDENDIKAFKVDTISKDNNYYKITTTTPQLQEVYKELDIYGEFTPMLTNFMTNKELEQYIKVAVIESNVIDNLLDILGTTSYASSEDLIQVEIKPQKDGSVKAIVTINLIQNDNSFIDLKDMKNHELTFEMEMTLKLKTHNEINFTKIDVGANVDIEITKSLAIKPKEEYWKDFSNEENKNDIKSIEKTKEILKQLKPDTAEGEQNLGEGRIPTPIPGITVNIGVSLVEKLKIAFQLSSSESTIVKTNFGFKDGIKKSDKVGFYWNSDVSTTNEAFEALGKAELRIGIMPMVEINFIEAIKVGASINVGGYGEGQINYSISKEDEEEKIDGKFSYGIYVVGKIYARAVGLNKPEFTIYENKFDLSNINRDILEEERKAKEEAEKKAQEEALAKVLNGDFSYFAGTYTSTTVGAENIRNVLTLDKNGKVTITDSIRTG